MGQGELTRRRWGGGGLLLLVLLAILLVAPLLGERGNDHPLASRERIDACALLPVSLAVPGRASLRPGIDRCDVLDDQGAVVLGVGLSSLRSIGATNRHGTREFYATWLKEVRASGAVDLQEQAGPWKMASTYRLGGRRQFLAEDGGLLIVLDSDRMEPDALVRVAAVLAPALRAPDSAATR